MDSSSPGPTHDWYVVGNCSICSERVYRCEDCKYPWVFYHACGGTSPPTAQTPPVHWSDVSSDRSTASYDSDADRASNHASEGSNGGLGDPPSDDPVTSPSYSQDSGPGYASGAPPSPPPPSPTLGPRCPRRRRSPLGSASSSMALQETGIAPAAAAPTGATGNCRRITPAPLHRQVRRPYTQGPRHHWP